MLETLTDLSLTSNVVQMGVYCNSVAALRLFSGWNVSTAACTTECITELKSGQFKHMLFFIAKLEVSQGWTQKKEKKNKKKEKQLYV